MTDNTIKQRQSALRERERQAGLLRRTVTIPEKRAGQLKEIVAQWMKEDSEPPLDQVSR